MPKRKKKSEAPAAVVAPAEESTTFPRLESPSGTELSEKERAEQTQFKPLVTSKDGK